MPDPKASQKRIEALDEIKDILWSPRIARHEVALVLKRLRDE